MLLQTWGSLQQLKTLVNDKGHDKLKFELPWRDEERHKYDFLNQMINAISQVWKNPVLSNLKAFLLIDTSIILNWLLRGTNLSTKNCLCWISFLNYMIRDILQWRIYNTIYHSSFRCCIEGSVRVSNKKSFLHKKMSDNTKNKRAVTELF